MVMILSAMPFSSTCTKNSAFSDASKVAVHCAVQQALYDTFPMLQRTNTHDYHT